MELPAKFNTLTAKEYFFCIDNHKKYTNFNVLGLYRSITENEKLDLPAKIEVREYAHRVFKKSFDFLQLKDPRTYFEVSTLGHELTKADENRFWQEVRKNQQQILESKQIRHRNFGVYSKHACGYEDCPYDGVMFQQGSWYLSSEIHFESDANNYQSEVKSRRFRKERKQQKKIIRTEMEEE